MEKRKKDTTADQDYSKAHDMHYNKKDLPKALKLYRDIIADYPGTDEAGYSFSQVHNIVKAVLPKQEILDALAALTIVHFEQDLTSAMLSN